MIQNSSNHANDITVVIPTYNRSEELARALDALVAQTDADFDVIVCDDGSTENISAVTTLYQDCLRLCLLRIENSGGPARPRNVATDAAKSRWVSFLDSDDWWFPERVARVKMALGDDCDIVFHQLRVDRADGNIRTRPAHGALLGDTLKGTDPLMHMIRFGNPLPTSATTVRRDLMQRIGGFDESRDLSSVEDFDAWLRLIVSGARLKRMPEILGAYWVGADQISAFNVRQYERQRHLFRRQLEMLPSTYRARARSNFGYLLGSYAIDLSLPGAREHFRQIEFKCEPLRWLKAHVKMWRARLRATDRT